MPTVYEASVQVVMLFCFNCMARAPLGSGSTRDTEKYTLWFRSMATMPVGRYWGRDVLGYLWMALPLTWTSLYTWIFVLTTVSENFARSVVVVAFALTTAGVTGVQHARSIPRPNMQ